MTTPITHNTSPKTAQDFSDFEKEALEVSSLHDLKLDLQHYLSKLHRDQKEDIAERISTIEKRCNEEVRATLEKHIKLQLEKHFQGTLKSLQGEVMKLFSPLLMRAEEDVVRLHSAVNKTNGLCQDIQQKYAFRWSRPFGILLFSTALTGAFMGIMLYLMQVTPLAVFLMNEETRKTYRMGQLNVQLEGLSHQVKQIKKSATLKEKTLKAIDRPLKVENF